MSPANRATRPRPCRSAHAESAPSQRYASEVDAAARYAWSGQLESDRVARYTCEPSMPRPPSYADHELAARCAATGMTVTASEIQTYREVGLLEPPIPDFPGG